RAEFSVKIVSRIPRGVGSPTLGDVEGVGGRVTGCFTAPLGAPVDVAVRRSRRFLGVSLLFVRDSYVNVSEDGMWVSLVDMYRSATLYRFFQDGSVPGLRVLEWVPSSYGYLSRYRA